MREEQLAHYRSDAHQRHDDGDNLGLLQTCLSLFLKSSHHFPLLLHPFPSPLLFSSSVFALFVANVAWHELLEVALLFLHELLLHASELLGLAIGFRMHSLLHLGSSRACVEEASALPASYCSSYVESSCSMQFAAGHYDSTSSAAKGQNNIL